MQLSGEWCREKGTKTASTKRDTEVHGKVEM